MKEVGPKPSRACLAHDDGAINGQLQVQQGGADLANHTLHPVNLLPQEDVHGSNGPHLFQPCPHLQTGSEEMLTAMLYIVK